MDISTIALLISSGTLSYSLLDRVFTGSWNLSRKFKSLEDSLTEKIDGLRHEVDGNHRSHVHDVGETISALKEHIQLEKIYVRENCVLKDHLNVLMQPYRELIQVNFSNMNGRLDRIEKKIDAQEK